MFPTACSNDKVVTKKVENNLRKNEVNSPNHVHLMWQVDYKFSGGILTQAVFDGGQRPLRQPHAKNYELSAAIPTLCAFALVINKRAIKR